MASKIIWWIVVFGCALIFYSIGIYADKSEKPIHFYSGTEVEASSICDIKQYNKENGRMWKLYSLWYVASGVAASFSLILAVILLVLSCTIGIFILVFTYHKILKKYSMH